ncbi:MAG: sensor histidine kinase [Caldilineaceae bacterium]|nr:sensor histidine kinase [Caldilineaceae bacterium]
MEKQRELNVKSAIIQEVHHRVKNNLQTIAAMLRIQARRSESEETKQALTGAVNRILSMSVIHEFLSQDEHRPINIRDVCQRIADQVTRVAASPDQEIDIRVQGPTIRLPASQATPMAMVVNELLLNALEHGLADVNQGQILIELGDLGDAVQIVVQDDGAGLPPGFDPEQSKSLGLQIVHTLVTDDLKGELRLETGATLEHPTDGEHIGGGKALSTQIGTRAIVTFPKRSLRVD